MVAYSPLYDLVNTRIHISGDRFAFQVNGKNDKLKIRDFAAVATRWGLEKSKVSAFAYSMAEGIRSELPEILALSGLPSQQQAQYASIVESNFASIQLQ